MGISYQEVRSEQVPATDTLHYTVLAGTTVEITQGTMCNESTGSETFSFFIPNPDAAAGLTNTVIDTKAVLAGQTDLLSALIGKRFSAGTTFRTTASDGSSLNMHLSLMIRTN